MSLKTTALSAQLDIIREHINERVLSGCTFIELFDWEPGCGNCSIFRFRVTKEHLEALKDEMDFTYKEIRNKRNHGMLWWKETDVYFFYSVSVQ